MPKVLQEPGGRVIVLPKKAVAVQEWLVGRNDHSSKVYGEGENFLTWFGRHRSQGCYEESIISYRGILRDSVGRVVMEELGEESKAKILFTQLASLVEEQIRGATQVLLTDGNFNIFFVPDCDDFVRMVRVYYRCRKWVFSANEVDSAFGLGVGCRIFSPVQVPSMVE